MQSYEIVCNFACSMFEDPRTPERPSDDGVASAAILGHYYRVYVDHRTCGRRTDKRDGARQVRAPRSFHTKRRDGSGGGGGSSPLPPPPSYICLSKERDIELCAADCGDIIKSAFERRRERSTRSFRARSSMRDHRNCGRETDTSSRKLIYL